jgi:DNA-binding NtrC family response regulator
VISIAIPPLHRRKTDIPHLINYFIKKYTDENDKEVIGINREALDQLMKYDFPGNVRELENIIEHAVVMCRDNYISQQDLPSQLKVYSPKSILDPYQLEEGYEKKLRLFETEMIQEALKQSNGNQSAAARLLGITERHLRSRLEKLNLKKNPSR